MDRATSFLRRLTLPLTLLVACGCAASEGRLPAARASGAGASRAKVDVSYTLPVNKPSLNEPVFLEFTMKNGLTQAVEADFGQDFKHGFLFAVRLPDGTDVQLPQWRREGISRVGRFTLEPGQTYTQRVLLNEWYEFPAPGRYELSARLTAPVKTPDGESIGDSAEFRTTVEVRPRDAARLEQLAARTFGQLDGATSYEEAARAAETLSHIKDPVAVPYLERALASDRMVEPILIRGLEKIGDDEAVRVLTSASENPNGDVAELARAALERIKAKPRRGEQ